MRRFFVLAALVAATSSAAAPSAALHDVCAIMLVSSEPDVIMLGAKCAHHNGAGDARLFDLVAERYALMVGAGELAAAQVDALAWLAEALGSTRDPRYRAVLQRPLPTAGDWRSSRVKVRNRIEDALKAIGKGGASFEPSAVSLEALRASVFDARPPPRATIALPDSVQPDDTLETVYEKLGPPASAGAHEIQVFRPVVGRLHLQLLALEYPGWGSVRMEHRGGRWAVSDILVQRSSAGLAVAGGSQSLIERVMSVNPDVYRAAAQTIIAERRFEQDVLDAAARRIVADSQVHDGPAIDGLAWLCRSIGASGNGRYRDALQHVSKTAAERKLRSYAKSALGELHQGAVEQLRIEGVVPGDHRAR